MNVFSRIAKVASLALLLLSASVQAGGRCPTSCPASPPKSCQEIQSIRRQKAALWERDQRSAVLDARQGCYRMQPSGGSASANACASCNSISATRPQSVDFFNQTMCSLARVPMSDGERRIDLRNGILQAGRQAVQETQAKRNHDIHAMMRFYGSHPEWQRITVEEMRAAESRFRTHVNSVVAKMDQTGAGIQSTRENTRRYVSESLRIELEKATTQLSEISISQWARTFDFSGIPNENQARFKELLQLAQSPDRGSQGASPYFARMILLHHLENKVIASGQGTQVLDSLAQSSDLKYHPFSGEARWENTVFHDGYLNGSMPWQIAGSLNQRSRGVVLDQSQGVDCSALVQWMLESVGFPKSWFFRANEAQPRTDTPHMINSWAKDKAAFQMDALCSEEQLEPGDIVVNNHHTYVFSGFRDSRQRMQMNIIEATGNGNRTMREAEINPFESADCSHSRWTSPFQSAPDEPAECQVHYVMKVKSVPAR